MGLVRVILDGGDYRALDMEMSARGYMRTIPGTQGDQERLYLLPPGTYWRIEPSEAAELRDETKAAAKAAGETGARIIVTAGPSAWDGLVQIDE